MALQRQFQKTAGDALVALQGAVTRLSEVKVKDTKSTLTPSQLLSVEGASRFDSIIQWQAEQKITARVRSIETGRLFVDDKTYLLVGLSGDLGRSIARFMIEGGACHIVLSSRSPKIDPQWIEDMAEAGGNIMVLPMDVSNEASVDSGLATIRASMPPIAGVAFGPLVLQDVMFNNMDLSLMEMVLAPKVTGARLLNERLSDPSSPLDFFVMFSSFVMVSENPGQAAYSAANAFTHALAQQRRSRGMAGSTIDIGAVYGVGFIARAGREEEYDVVRFMFDEVNEWELHALFAEAVVAGRAPGTDQVELVTGMPYVDPADRDQIPYFDDPRLAYYKLADGRNKGDELVSAKGSVQERLLKAETMDEVRAIILEGVSAKIRGALQVAASDDLNLTSPLVDQGVDSLSAVAIGTWFSRNLSVDIPLLKVLGGASVSDLVEESISRILPGAIPLAYDGSANEVLKDEAPVAVEVEAMGLASNSGRYDDLSLPNDYMNVPTPISLLPSPSDQKAEGVERIAPLSIAQEYCWKQQQLGLDPSTFNSTIGMFMQGALDLNRLSWAFNQALQRHDAFRTSFVTNPADKSRPLQSLMKSPAVGFETIKVVDRAAAEKGFKDLERYEDNFSEGMTLKVVNYCWSSTDHLLVFAYHRLVGDGWTTEHQLVEAGQLYNGVQLDPPPSYADFAVRQRKDLVSGAAENDLSYWSTLFKTLPVRLPMLDVPGKRISASPTWSEHETSARLNPMIAVRIKDRSRKHKTTPMHFYLAAFHVLLARLTTCTDVAIGVADTNRSTLTDQATMGFFASLLPVRLRYSPDNIFAEVLIAVKDEIRAALLHSAVPYGAILEHLGLSNPSAADPESQAPLFQAVFDYKQGQAETGSIGRANIVESRTSRAGSPYDITLEMSDDSNKDPLIIPKLQSERYASGDAEVVMDSYLSILSIFSRNSALRVEDGRLDQGARAKP